MKYVIDRIEENILVLENIETGNIIEVRKELIDGEVAENTVVIFDNDNYVISKEDENKRRESIRERMLRLRTNSGDINEQNR